VAAPPHPDAQLQPVEAPWWTSTSSRSCSFVKDRLKPLVGS